MTLPDVSRFERLNVSDTCAVWNVLSSLLLHRTAIGVGIQFCITDYVRYECLEKERSSETSSDKELQGRLRAAQARGVYRSYQLTVEDLQEMTLLERRKRLGKGELSSIAFAMRTNQAFHTDDRGARKLGREVLSDSRVQTTPHLLGHLVFQNRLSDGGAMATIEEHRRLDRPLEAPFERMYEEALRCRLLASTPPRDTGIK